MRRTVTITEDKIREVKRCLKKMGIRETSRLCGVSYYTAWCISQGKYDTTNPLQFDLGNVCPITGFKIYNP